MLSMHVAINIILIILKFYKHRFCFYLIGLYSAGPFLTPAPLTPALITPVSKIGLTPFRAGVKWVATK